mgnify:CR=1 FL=1
MGQASWTAWPHTEFASIARTWHGEQLMTTEMLLGDEAVALGALHSGIGGAFSYPGTPATEILEFVQARADSTVSALWSANEKVAYEEALGMSYAGKRALVSMKHVGLNVAADPFMSSALTGARAGLVLAVADDPGMHSSQNEQDTRYFAEFAHLPLFEPSNQQEVYDMTREAFEASERWSVPIIVRLVTRLAHSRSPVRLAPLAQVISPKRPIVWREWTLLPVNARVRFRRLLELQPQLREYAEHSPWNLLELRGKKGVIATGLGNNYLREVIGDRSDFSTLKLCVYPPPAGRIRQLVDHFDYILVIEEGYPFIERQVSGLLGLSGKHVRGKNTGALPADGELSTEVVRAALAMAPVTPFEPLRDLPARPPRLCDGCPHCDTFRALTEAVRDNPAPYLLSDIGCYTLGALPPSSAVQTGVDMNASVSMALGAAKAGVTPVVCTIGDSTFVHSGMTGLIGAAHADADMTVIILDNATVGMTGGQEVMATGDDLLALIRGLGVSNDQLFCIEPLPKHHAKNVEILRQAIAHKGLSVIVAQRPCIQQVQRQKRQAAAAPA